MSLAANMSNSSRANVSVTPTNSTIPNLPGEMQVIVTLKKVSVGTEVDITQAGVPDIIPPEACYLGWQESLRNLARLVEPEINQ